MNARYAMNPGLGNAPRWSKGRAKARSPLGGYIARFLDPRQDYRAIALELFGEERTKAWFRALGQLRFAGIEWGSDYHDGTERHIGRFFAWVCMLLERAGANPKRVYCGRGLFQGQTRRWDPALRCVVSVPKKSAGGVAVRLGVCVRTVQAYAAAAQAIGIVQRWQVQRWEEVQRLPKPLRGKRYSYSFLQWIGDVPRTVRVKLAEWAGQRVPREQPAAAAETGQESPRAPAAGSSGAALAATLLAGLLEEPDS